jgi:hypothetical protein
LEAAKQEHKMSKDVSRTIVSAAPGWYVATLCPVVSLEGPDDFDFVYDPIVAWQITREENRIPQSAGAADHAFWHAIKRRQEGLGPQGA